MRKIHRKNFIDTTTPRGFIQIPQASSHPQSRANLASIPPSKRTKPHAAPCHTIQTPLPIHPETQLSAARNNLEKPQPRQFPPPPFPQQLAPNPSPHRRSTARITPSFQGTPYLPTRARQEGNTGKMRTRRNATPRHAAQTRAWRSRRQRSRGGGGGECR